MSGQKKHKTSIFLVLTLVLLMTTLVFVQVRVFNFLGTDKTDFIVQEPVDDFFREKFGDIEASKGMYLVLKESTNPFHFVDSSVKKRSLKYFYSLRAYSGAPPIIPHPILEKKTLTGEDCLGCHKRGGFVPKFHAYAPIVPHPKKLNCRQCHNPVYLNSLFKKNTWIKNEGDRGFVHLSGGPPVIPHSLQMRENCLACHGGMAAVDEIRTTHPERINCLQCHVERKVTDAWKQI